LTQTYQVTVVGTQAGASNYSVQASLSTTQEGQQIVEPLPDGDTLTLNGTAMTAAVYEPGLYAASGDGNLGQYVFAWTHDGTTYTNTATATIAFPATVPTTISLASPAALVVSDVPSGVTVTAAINSGDSVSYPTFRVPIDIGGVASPAAVDFSGLASGPGALAIDELSNAALQNPTAGGGSLSVLIQLGYGITITD
jgi:hypothetical protein